MDTKSMSQWLLAAYQRGETIRLPEDFTLTEQQAYQVQKEVSFALGYPLQHIRHWKVGASCKQSKGISAPIYPYQIYLNGSQLKRRDFRQLYVELEWAYRLGETVTEPVDVSSLDAVSSLFDNVYCAFELVDSRLTNWQSHSAALRLADNQVTAGLVLGEAISKQELVNPNQVSHDTVLDGDKHYAATGGHPLGQPLETIALTINDLITRVGQLEKGSIITTGSWNGLVPVAHAGHVQGCFSQQFSVDFHLVD